MPNTTEEGYRVIYCRLMSSKAEEFFPYDITAHCNNLLEIRLQNDVMIGDIYIIDMLNLSFGQISKLTPIAVKKSFTILEVKICSTIFCLIFLFFLFNIFLYFAFYCLAFL